MYTCLCLRGCMQKSVGMMLCSFLAACLLAAAFADHHDCQHDDPPADDHDDVVTDHYGCCSAEDRREVLQMWKSVWSSAFTDARLAIIMEMFNESAPLFFSFIFISFESGNTAHISRQRNTMHKHMHRKKKNTQST